MANDPTKITANNLSNPSDPELSKLLTKLKPIHYPTHSQWWPPAPGYIILTIIFFVFIYVLSRKLISKINYHLQSKPKKIALNEINEIEIELRQVKSQPIEVSKIIYGALIQRTCILLKKSAITKYEDSKSLSGEDWLEFLIKTGKSTEFDSNIAKLINKLAYQSDLNNYTEEELETSTRTLINTTKNWIKINL